MGPTHSACCGWLHVGSESARCSRSFCRDSRLLIFEILQQVSKTVARACCTWTVLKGETRPTSAAHPAGCLTTSGKEVRRSANTPPEVR